MQDICILHVTQNENIEFGFRNIGLRLTTELIFCQKRALMCSTSGQSLKALLRLEPLQIFDFPKKLTSLDIGYHYATDFRALDRVRLMNFERIDRSLYIIGFTSDFFNSKATCLKFNPFLFPTEYY